jgi:molybdopterin converting factor small subunit
VRWANVFVDDVNVRDVNDLETPVPGGATVLILPAMAGGSA